MGAGTLLLARRLEGFARVSFRVALCERPSEKDFAYNKRVGLLRGRFVELVEIAGDVLFGDLRKTGGPERKVAIESSGILMMRPRAVLLLANLNEFLDSRLPACGGCVMPS
jgi:hypothetical protein